MADTEKTQQERDNEIQKDGANSRVCNRRGFNFQNPYAEGTREHDLWNLGYTMEQLMGG